MRRQSSNGALLTDASGSLRCACRKMLTLGSILTSGPGASMLRPNGRAKGGAPLNAKR